MQRAHTGISLIIDKDKRGQFAGITLGSSHHPDHTKGIGGIQSTLGVPEIITPDKSGAAGRKVNRRSPDVRILPDHSRGFTYLALLPSSDWSDLTPAQLDRMMNILAGDTITPIHTAWSNSTFAIRVRTAEHGEKLTQLASAFLRRAMLVYVGDGNPLPHGLTLVMQARLPKPVREALVKYDEDAFWLQRELAKSGVSQRLVEAGLGNYTLTPQFLDPSEPFGINSAHRICVVLKFQGLLPRRFTIEELDHWMVEQTTMKRSA